MATSDTIWIRCERCNTVAEYPPSLVGRQVLCRRPDCGAVFALRLPSDEERPEVLGNPVDRAVATPKVPLSAASESSPFLHGTEFDSLPSSHRTFGIKKNHKLGFLTATTISGASTLTSFPFPAAGPGTAAMANIITRHLQPLQSDRQSLFRLQAMAAKHGGYHIRVMRPRKRLGRRIIDIAITDSQGDIHVCVYKYQRDTKEVVSKMYVVTTTLLTSVSALLLFVFALTSPGRLAELSNDSLMEQHNEHQLEIIATIAVQLFLYNCLAYAFNLATAGILLGIPLAWMTSDDTESFNALDQRVDRAIGLALTELGIPDHVIRRTNI